MFVTQYAELALAVDEVAERIRAMGEVPKPDDPSCEFEAIR